MKPRIILKRWWIPLPLPSYDGITIYPFIFVRRDTSKKLLRHELIHFWQVRKTGWFRFYGMYIWDALRKSYRDIPVEKEAYEHQHDEDYLPPDLEALVNG
jgi:hypothetical protein